jgi:hypothetical protein
MTTHPTVRPHRLISLVVLAGILAGACTPGGSTPAPDPSATSALVGAGSSASRPTTSPGAATPAAATPATGVPVSPTATASPAVAQATRTPTSPPQIAQGDPEPFAMNLADKDDFVAQHTFEWCVGASLQMAWNMSTDDRRSSKTDQGKLWAMARDRSFSPFGGANPRGWTATLNDLGIGPYELVSLPTFEAALGTAAEAIRATDRPVGLVMWRGRHAWVMSGFESTADPRDFDAFDVTGIRVHDPLYPHGSVAWGKSPKPNSLVSPETLAKQFVLRDSTRVNLGVPPGFLLVLPVADEA